ncbi:unnamed protein product, partial [Heterotrigona itama]
FTKKKFTQRLFTQFTKADGVLSGRSDSHSIRWISHFSWKGNDDDEDDDENDDKDDDVKQTERLERAEYDEREECVDRGVTGFDNSDSKIGESLIDCEFIFAFCPLRRKKCVLLGLLYVFCDRSKLRRFCCVSNRSNSVVINDEERCSAEDRDDDVDCGVATAPIGKGTPLFRGEEDHSSSVVVAASTPSCDDTSATVLVSPRIVRFRSESAALSSPLDFATCNVLVPPPSYDCCCRLFLFFLHLLLLLPLLRYVRRNLPILSTVSQEFTDARTTRRSDLRSSQLDRFFDSDWTPVSLLPFVKQQQCIVKAELSVAKQQKTGDGVDKSQEYGHDGRENADGGYGDNESGVGGRSDKRNHRIGSAAGSRDDSGGGGGCSVVVFIVVLVLHGGGWAVGLAFSVGEKQGEGELGDGEAGDGQACQDRGDQTDEESTVISSPDAVVQPLAMMVESDDAFVADGTVLGPLALGGDVAQVASAVLDHVRVPPSVEFRQNFVRRLRPDPRVRRIQQNHRQVRANVREENGSDHDRENWA